jgi:tetratricopeptide (TPR) repeat protein
MKRLAVSYNYAGRHDEALKLQEQIVPLRKKALGPENPDTLGSMNDLADSYDAAGRHDEALKLRDEVLAFGAERPSTNAAVMEQMAYTHYALGRNQEAIALLEQSCKLNPTDTFSSLKLAVWQAWFGQDAAYEDTRHRLIQQGEGTNQAPAAEQAAKAGCIRPSTDAALLKKALILAQRAVEVGKGGDQAPWCQLALGMAEYRNGQYAATGQPLTIADQTVGNIPVMDGYYPRQIQGAALLYQAMSLFRQGKQEEARRLFSQAEAQMPPLPKDDRKPFVDGKPADFNDLICWLAYKEARALIGVPSGLVAAPTGPK